MLKENMILKIEEEDYRIIDFDTKNFKYFLISMKDNSWPIEVHLDVIEEMFNEDKIKVDKSDKYPSIVLQNIGVCQESCRINIFLSLRYV